MKSLRKLTAAGLLLVSLSGWTAQLAGTSYDSAVDDRATGLLQAGSQLLDARKSTQAIEDFDKVIALYENTYRGQRGTMYSARSTSEALAYATTAANEKRLAKVVSPNWAYGYYMKAYVLEDLGRIDEAKALLLRAVELAPRNSQFLSELATVYSHERNWPQAMRAFQEAQVQTEFSPPNLKNNELARAWRGQAFVYAEQGQYDEATRLYRKCLSLNGNDTIAQNELRYVETRRAQQGGEQMAGNGPGGASGFASSGQQLSLQQTQAQAEAARQAQAQADAARQAQAQADAARQAQAQADAARQAQAQAEAARQAQARAEAARQAQAQADAARQAQAQAEAARQAQAQAEAARQAQARAEAARQAQARAEAARQAQAQAQQQRVQQNGNGSLAQSAVPLVQYASPPAQSAVGSAQYAQQPRVQQSANTLAQSAAPLVQHANAPARNGASASQEWWENRSIQGRAALPPQQSRNPSAARVAYASAQSTDTVTQNAYTAAPGWQTGNTDAQYRYPQAQNANGAAFSQLAAQVAGASVLASGDAGTYEWLNPSGNPSGVYYQLNRMTNGAWVSRVKLPNQGWTDTRCGAGCTYRNSTVNEVRQYFAPQYLQAFDVSCIQNTAMVFCRYAVKDNPGQGGHLVVALVTGKPVQVQVQRVDATLIR